MVIVKIFNMEYKCLIWGDVKHMLRLPPDITAVINVFPAKHKHVILKPPSARLTKTRMDDAGAALLQKARATTSPSIMNF